MSIAREHKLELNLAIAGATGNVGREMVKVLRQRKFPTSRLSLLASRARAEVIEGRPEQIHALDDFSFAGTDIAFFAISNTLAARHASRAKKSGCTVIDNSSHFRMKESIPLIVPEVNGEQLQSIKRGDLVANPNCATAQLVCALQPLHEAAGLKRVIVSTYQSASGAGCAPRDELEAASRQFLVEGAMPRAENFPKPLVFNVLPQIGAFAADGRTGEEEKVEAETAKILNAPELKISATCVRVPVDVGHGEAVNVELAKPLSVAKARELLASAPGLCLMDEHKPGGYATPLDAATRDEVFVSRLRRCSAFEHGLSFWVVSDNLRKGAALNAVQIAEHLQRQGVFAA